MLQVNLPTFLVKAACFIGLLLPVSLTFAQNFNDPYSSLGFGRVHQEEFSALDATPALAMTQKGEASYSLVNPASLSSLEYMTFNVGMNGKLTSLQRGDSTYDESRTGFGHVTLGFPVISDIGWGANLGLVPISHMGYNYETLPGEGEDYRVLKNGNGGLSKFFVSSGIDLFEGLSAGFRASYVFGNLDQKTSTEFDFSNNQLPLSKRNLQIDNIGDFAFEGGLQYHRMIGEELELGIGLSGNIPSSLDMDRDFLSVAYVRRGARREPVDTITETLDQEGTLEMPAIYNFGVTLNKTQHWRLGANFAYEQWSDLEKMGRNQGLNDQYNVGLSGQLIPDADNVGSYWSQMRYRFGINYANTYLNFNEQSISMYSVNVGFGFPLARKKSTINAAFKFGTLGVDGDNLFQENFFGFNLGFTLNEKWFEKDRIK